MNHDSRNRDRQALFFSKKKKELFYFITLFECCGEREREGEREVRDPPYALWAQQAGMSQAEAKNHELPSGVLCECKGPENSVIWHYGPPASPCHHQGAGLAVEESRFHPVPTWDLEWQCHSHSLTQCSTRQYPIVTHPTLSFIPKIVTSKQLLGKVNCSLLLFISALSFNLLCAK